MRILGIDPGIGRCGWGIVESQKSKVRSQNYGCIETSQKLTQEQRLYELHTAITKIIKVYKPEVLSIEKLYFGTNVTTAFSVGQARGVVLLTAGQNKLPVFEYAPVQVKLAVTGYGKAEKSQIGQMVKVILKLKEIPKPDDTADALAIALTHAFSAKISVL
jgi:crossover junction endodeoxyribonuclease RuvC